uniref:Uncharacterized protein n=1 Tax=Romanomermis culicivorax TaxID=13658 RepID=A0A915K1K8_ROMCU
MFEKLLNIVLNNNVLANIVQRFMEIMLIGDSCVGKTCLLIRFKDNAFLHNNFIATVGMDYRIKRIDLDGLKVKLQIWDTAGQERFRSITHAYYRDADAILLLFDISNRATFEHLRSWLSDAKDNGRETTLMYIIGNKLDLGAQRQVKVEEAEKFAEVFKRAALISTTHGLTYMETSGKTGANVDNVFRHVALDLTKKRGEKCVTENGITLFEDSKRYSQSHVRTQVCSSC